jgi:hypothetical protein
MTRKSNNLSTKTGAKTGAKPDVARAPVGQETGTGKMTNAKAERPQMGRQQRLAPLADKYANLPANKDMQLPWAHTGSDVESWLAAGAVPVKVSEQKPVAVYKGINDHAGDNEYVKVAGVSWTKGGDRVDAFLLKMPKDLYEEVKILPDQQRTAEVRRAMGMLGHADVADVKSDDGSAIDGLKTYQPLIDGSQANLQTFQGGELTGDV